MSMPLLTNLQMQQKYTYTGADPVLKGYATKGLSLRNAFAAELYSIWAKDEAYINQNFRIWTKNETGIERNIVIDTVCYNFKECDLGITSTQSNFFFRILSKNTLHAIFAYNRITGANLQIATSSYHYSTKLFRTGSVLYQGCNVILRKRYLNGSEPYVEAFSKDTLTNGANKINPADGSIMDYNTLSYMTWVRLLCFEDSVKVGEQQATYQPTIPTFSEALNRSPKENEALCSSTLYESMTKPTKQIPSPYVALRTLTTYTI